MLDPQPAHLGDERGIGGTDLGQLHAASSLSFSDLDVVDQLLDHPIGPDLVDLVDLTQHSGRIGNVQTQIETLGQLAIVHPHQHRRQTKINMESLKRGQCVTSGNSTS